MSLQNLIHHILFKERLYEPFLSPQQYADACRVVENEPDSTYGPESDEPNCEQIQHDILDQVYSRSLTRVGIALTGLGFDVKETFSDYLE